MSATARTGAAAGHPGLLHEALIYGTDDEVLAVAVPFLRGGVDAGDPTLVGVDPRTEALIREALGDPAGVDFLSGEHYATPFTALRLNNELFRERVAAGASQVRMLGQVPHSGAAAPWSAWARYEAAVNHLYSELPVWSICPYDARTTADDVLADVRRTHTHLVAPDGSHRPSPAFTDPADFLTERARTEVDVLEQTAPHVDLSDPSPAESRHAVVQLAREVPLHDDAVEGLALAVTEVVTNATVHGRAPVRLRAWAAPDRVVVAVRDRGPGPPDPYVGLLPGGGREGGVGLWMSNLMCHQVTLSQEPDGFNVRLVAAA